MLNGPTYRCSVKILLTGVLLLAQNYICMLFLFQFEKHFYYKVVEWMLILVVNIQIWNYKYNARKTFTCTECFDFMLN